MCECLVSSNFWPYNECLRGCRGFVAANIAVSQLQGPLFHPELWLLSVGFFWVSTPSQKHDCRWVDYATLLVTVNQ